MPPETKLRITNLYYSQAAFGFSAPTGRCSKESDQQAPGQNHQEGWQGNILFSIWWGAIENVPDFSGSQGRGEGRVGKEEYMTITSKSVIKPIFIKYNLKQFIKYMQ